MAETVLTFTAHNIHRVTKPTGMKKEHTGIEKVIASFTLGFAIKKKIKNFLTFTSDHIYMRLSVLWEPLCPCHQSPPPSPCVNCRGSIIWPLTAPILSQQNSWNLARERERVEWRRETHRGTDRETETDSSASRAPICLWWCSSSCQGLCQIDTSDLISVYVHLSVFMSICPLAAETVASAMCLSQ